MVTERHWKSLNNNADNQFLHLDKEAFPHILGKKMFDNENWNKNDFSFTLAK